MIRSLFSRQGLLLVTIVLLGSTLFGNVTVEASTAYTGMRNMTALQLTSDMKAGWNLGNSLDAIGGETNWGNPKTTHAMIDSIKAKGFDTIRIPVTWQSHIGAAPNYTIDPAWLSRVEEVMNYAFDNNMYVILNTHHDEWVVPTYENQDQVTDKLTKVWIQIANRYKNYSDYLIFETLNEPRQKGGVDEWRGGTAENRDIVNKYNLAAVNAIRSTGGNNASRFIMTPTIAASSTSSALQDFVVPNDDSRIIVSIHKYSPYSFAMNMKGTSSWGSPADKAAMDKEFDILYNKFIQRGRAVVIGEFGTVNKDNTSNRVIHAQYCAQLARTKGMLLVWWDNGHAAKEYALFNRNDLTWPGEEVAQALIKGATQ